MSSQSSIDAAGFSGLGVGCDEGGRGTLLKKDVIGLYTGLLAAAAVAGGVVEAARVCGGERVRAALVGGRGGGGGGGWGGGESDSACSESSDEGTRGLFRAERSLAMARQHAGCEELLAVQAAHGRFRRARPCRRGRRAAGGGQQLAGGRAGKQLAGGQAGRRAGEGRERQQRADVAGGPKRASP